MRGTVFATLVCACSVGPRYERPAAELPQKWRAEPAVQESLANVKWWELFSDEKLQGLVRQALEHNTDLRLAAARVEELGAQVGIARSALFPQVELGASAARARTNTLGVVSTNDVFAINGQVSYQTDFWGQYRGLTAEARAALLA
jgi:multidrug efflux system outer membrane protein